MGMRYFLKIEGLEGESNHALHDGAIELNSWMWGDDKPLKHIICVKDTDSVTVDLVRALAEGTEFSEAALTSEYPNGKDEVAITMQNVFVAELKTKGEGGSVSKDTITLEFEKVDIDYGHLDPAG
jgi:type VI protein secretion system component Hcp